MTFLPSASLPSTFREAYMHVQGVTAAETLPFLWSQPLASSRSALSFQSHDFQFQTPGSNRRSLARSQDPSHGRDPIHHRRECPDSEGELMRHKVLHPLILWLNDVTSCWDPSANLDLNVQNLHNITLVGRWPSAYSIITGVFLLYYNTVLIIYFFIIHFMCWILS